MAEQKIVKMGARRAWSVVSSKLKVQERNLPSERAWDWISLLSESVKRRLGSGTSLKTT